MNLIENNKIITSIFVGVHLTTDLRLQLKHSPSWKQACIAPKKSEGELIEIHHQGKDYLGCNIGASISLKDLRALETHIQERLHSYAPKWDTSSPILYILTQLLLA